jgi:hypothetical protein
MRAYVRVLVVLALAAVAFWVSTGITLSMVAGQRQPELIMRWWPPSASARAALAAQILQERPSRARLARARDLAIAALNREPVNVIASRTLGLTAALSGNDALAHRLFTYSESLSRRDVPTQLWLLEDRVQHNDVAGALLHYDRALRVSEGVRDLLLPVLAQASADPAIAPQLARLVTTRPSWWPYYLDHLLRESNSPRAVAQVIATMRLNPNDEIEGAWLGRALDRLVVLGAYQPAYAIYRNAVRRPDEGALIRNGDFEASDKLPTFEWALVDEPGLGAVREPREGAAGGGALSVVSSSGRSGEVARQLILLRPGAYRLAVKAGEVPQDAGSRPALSVICSGAQPQGLTQIRLQPAGTAGNPNIQRFVVPASGCPAQWIIISTGTDPDEQGSTPWIDDIRIVGD